MGGGAEVSILNMTDAEKYYHELPRYRKRVVEMQDKINELDRLVYEVFYMLEDLRNNTKLLKDPEFKVAYTQIAEKVLKS